MYTAANIHNIATATVPDSSMDLYNGQLKAQCAINRDKGLGSMKFSGKLDYINTVAMACFITMINLHGTTLPPTTAKFLKDEIVSGSVCL